MQHATHARPMREGALLAVLAAFAFGVTTPLVRRFGEDVAPFATATLLYAGAALASLPIGAGPAREARIRRAHVPRLVLLAAVGAFVAPACLAWGLQRTSGSVASLLLNVEAIFTVLLAWRVHREPIGSRVAAAVVLMAVGGACLVLEGFQGGQVGWGAVAVVLATFGWALDNTLTRPFASLDPTAVVRAKSAVGAALSGAASVALASPFPSLRASLGLLACGAVGYGLSLRLYLLAQRRIGAARTGSVFAVAPFLGVATAFAMGERSTGILTSFAAVLFAIALALHLTERHGHRHAHERLVHEHAHRHDDGHHDHVHDPPFAGAHSHEHVHEARTHTHPHAPDEHHRHRH